MISVIIPIKNGAAFIADTLRELSAVTAPYEVIVVNDGSTDATESIIAEFAAQDVRIRGVDNPGIGKVQALNHGFALATGTVIKCIDGDDVLVRGYIDELAPLAADEAECHDMQLTDQILQPIGCYTVNPAILAADRGATMERLVSLPRCTWTFGRQLAERIFPMPLDLPFEDVWFSLMITRYATAIRYRQGLCYQYRQHGNQTFGGILNQQRDKVLFRAERMLRLIAVLEREAARFQPEAIGLDTRFAGQRRYWELLASPSVSTWCILTSGLRWPAKAKLLLFRRLPWLTSFVLRLKYRMDYARLRWHGSAGQGIS